MFAAFATVGRGPALSLRFTVPGLVAGAVGIPVVWTLGVGLLVDAPSPAVRFGPVLSSMVVLPAWAAVAAGFELAGDGTPRRVAVLAALAAVPWLGLSLVFSPAQVVAVPLLLAAVCYGAQDRPTRELPVARAWSEARIRFRRAIFGRSYRWRAGLLAAPAMAAVACVGAVGFLVRWMGTIPTGHAGLEVLLVPLVALFGVPLIVGWAAVAALPVARGPMVRYLRSFFTHAARTTGLAAGSTALLLLADVALLVTVVCWGATSFLGAWSPVGTISLVVTTLGLIPATLGRLVLADIAIRRGGDAFDTAWSAVQLVAHHPLELLRLLSFQSAVAALATGAVLIGPAEVLFGAWILGDPTVGLLAAIVAGFLAGALAWTVGPPIWVLLALHRLGTLARCLEPAVGPDTPTLRLGPARPAPRGLRSSP